MWSINRWASHAELLKISTMNFLYSSINRNNKTYLNGKIDSDLSPSSSRMGFGDQPSHPAALPAEWPPSLRLLHPKQELPPPSAPHSGAGSAQPQLGARSTDSKSSLECAPWWDGKGFSDPLFEMTQWSARRGRTRWEGCSQALRTEVPQMNFFFFESIVYFSKYDVNQRTGGSLNHKI